ncbi:hypothetical protein Hte_006864 [Hypoxylon texense]
MASCIAIPAVRITTWQHFLPPIKISSSETDGVWVAKGLYSYHMPGDRQACFDNFQIECRDPIHDTRCVDEEAPT